MEEQSAQQSQILIILHHQLLHLRMHQCFHPTFTELQTVDRFDYDRAIGGVNAILSQARQVPHLIGLPTQTSPGH